ncbi:hypothetical protein HG530_009882 [Fusarium avenaceum]|nr:hypothetical protein HG530_009882 [Fusarium avenaceum]
MGNGGDTLHLDGVHLLKRMVQNTRGVNGLEAEILVVEVTDEQTLCGKGIRLDIDIGAGDALEETRLSNIGVTADKQCSGVGVDRWQTSEMLADLIEVHEWILESLEESGHATKSGPLELLALEQRLTVLDETDIIARNGLNQVLGG